MTPRYQLRGILGSVSNSLLGRPVATFTLTYLWRLRRKALGPRSWALWFRCVGPEGIPTTQRAGERESYGRFRFLKCSAACLFRKFANQLGKSRWIRSRIPGSNLLSHSTIPTIQYARDDLGRSFSFHTAYKHSTIAYIRLFLPTYRAFFAAHPAKFSSCDFICPIQSVLISASRRPKRYAHGQNHQYGHIARVPCSLSAPFLLSYDDTLCGARPYSDSRSFSILGGYGRPTATVHRYLSGTEADFLIRSFLATSCIGPHAFAPRIRLFPGVGNSGTSVWDLLGQSATLWIGDKPKGRRRVCVQPTFFAWLN
ncbi:hypothetical protein AG1IA_02397 [Rhizoctonia solani AG-1 IA]|uniref:Uncharacterized protein n=1 Tax=Thanatephorus cucumeris (strain AG1-IA) TaxID=983506 RepID=L8X027_THACA|nr:hypothetical protein AG1IA_02397 [Rhizoctonia solani AG-1 IA]